jgi:arsenate reductase
MAEALLRQIGGNKYEAKSAGLEAGQLNPLAVDAMRELEIDISQNKNKEVSTILEAGETFNYVITVCDEASAERCPVIPGRHVKLHWSFADPSQFGGSYEERMAQMRRVRDEIRERVARFVESMG